MDRAILKKSRSRAEDKVCRTLDIAVLVELPRTFSRCKHGVLSAEKSAIFEHQAVTFGMQGDCLTDWPGGILDGEIFEKFPVDFPVNGNLTAETGLLVTTSTAR